MAYNFTSLSAPDFEDLSRDLIGRLLRLRFEGFSAGPDGGIDGRHANAKGTIILQAKHYAGSRFSSLKSAIERELPSIRKLRPKRYILATSLPLTPTRKEQLKLTLGKHLHRLSDIIGQTELNDLLRTYPDIERNHIKLWLSSAGVLDRVVHSSAFAYTAASKSEIEGKVRVYAQNPSFKESKDLLEKYRMLIISGPPGVGKTTLAEMLSYAYIGDGWDFHAIRSLEDGFGAIVDAKKQIFFFDDFLGKVALDERSLSQKDTELARFMNRIRASPNARFILTTRAYIFEEARQISEQLADSRLDILKLVLDVGVYTRTIRARILYNHLLVSKMPRQYVKSLLKGDILPKIVDHENYNPRVIEWMTDQLVLSSITPSSYPDAFLKSLENPSKIWDTAFRKHIPHKCQHLLFALFFCSEYGADINELQLSFNALHPVLCKKFNRSFGIKDFEESLKILEGSFVSIFGENVTFINPSVRDYLTEYLQDQTILVELAPTAQTARWAENLWRFFVDHLATNESTKRGFAKLFLRHADQIPLLPVWRSIPGTQFARIQEITNSDRIQLLTEWWKAARSKKFLKAAIRIAEQPAGGFTAWHDGESLVRQVIEYREFAELNELCEAIESAIIELCNGWTPIDDLERIANAADEGKGNIHHSVISAIHQAISDAIESIDSDIATADSESTLTDQKHILKRLAERIDLDAGALKRLMENIEERISELQENTVTAEKPDFATRTRREPETFDDAAIKNLFATLIE